MSGERAAAQGRQEAGDVSKSKKPKPVVACVEHPSGWCAMRTNTFPEPGVFSVETRCDCYVVRPRVFSMQWPTCRMCQRRLRESP